MCVAALHMRLALALPPEPPFAVETIERRGIAREAAVGLHLLARLLIQKVRNPHRARLIWPSTLYLLDVTARSNRLREP